MILPVEAALERVPGSFLEASSDLGARPAMTFRNHLPLAMPGVVAGSIFTFSLTLGDYIMPTMIGNSSRPSAGGLHATGSSGTSRSRRRSPSCRSSIMGIYLRRSPAGGRVRGAMTAWLRGLRDASGRARRRDASASVHVPVLPARHHRPLRVHDPDRRFTFPPPGLTPRVVRGRVRQPEDMREALWLSLRVGAVAHVLALVLGSLAAAAV